MFQQVIKKSNWAYWDELDGAPLRDGEVLIIEWPDQTRTTNICHIQRDIFKYSDHGVECEGPDEKAYTIIPIYGLNVKVPLAQEGILCKRVKPS